MISVNQESISEQAVLNEMQYHPADNHRAAMVSAAQSLIIGKLLLQRADELNLTNNIDATTFADEKTYQDAVLEQLINQDIKIPQATSAECQQYYQANLSKFTTSPLVAARHILLPAPVEDINARLEAKALADEIIKQLKQGESFSVLASAHSKCDSSKHGGVLGQLSKGQTVAEFERQVFAASEGLMTHAVESRYGYHVVFIDMKIAGNQLPYDLVKQRITTYLNEKVKRKAIAQYIRHLISQANIDGFEFDIDASPLMQ
ncbi:peptidylprolyl isomerase [Shewanella inventionis]|uniref:peptidylprolyl isomerase n=1 Tax=Shewanella inventionis TaxID=1738770 RepID=A0ABQ1IV88_9GAMM|nr:peptidylprolyl isomerase [Shewanella inventionis]MCL1158360.1 peptidylprolyl isomerase [Shewanella inventionis]UAL41816.1 peptidylprolyl isomerase [Shewanella inventionis]GGB52110.1 peptidylprolyl isomerase [Shewanella inventionis]